jgi:hypothetical protein
MISYTDLFGASAPSWCRPQAIADMQKDGAGFAGFATWLDMTPAIPTCSPCPIRTAWSSCPGSRRWPGSPPICGWTASRSSRRRAIVLKRLIAEAAAEGLRVKTGVEANSS